MQLNPSLDGSLALVYPIVKSDLTATYPVEQQLMYNWCWAATAVSLCKFYHDLDIPNQQQFVARLTHKSICAAGPLKPYCNVIADLGAAMQLSGHLNKPYPSPLKPSDILTFNEGGSFLPIVCQMFLPQPGTGMGIGHAVSIIGANDNGQGGLTLWVADPGDGTICSMDYNQLVGNYRNRRGRWLRTYTTY